MPVWLDKSKQRWRFSFNRIVDGKRTRYTKLLPKGWDRARAEAFDRRETATLYAQATGLEKPVPLIQDAVTLYVRHRSPVMKSGRLIATELGRLFPIYEGRTFNELQDVALEYARDNHGLAPATVRNRLSYIRMACRYAWKHHGLGVAPPGQSMSMPVPDNERQVYLGAAELDRFWRAFEDTEARDLFRLAFFTGLRWISELLPRIPADVIRDHGVWLRVATTKNKAPRMVPIVDQAVPLLARLPFSRSRRHYYNAFMAAKTKAGLTDFRAHDLRHCLASAIISGLGNLSDVGAALGHKNLNSSKRYAHLYPGHLRDVLDRVSRKMHTASKYASKK